MPHAGRPGDVDGGRIRSDSTQAFGGWDFKGVATIHDESEQTCIARIESLLSGDDGGSALAEVAESEHQDQRRWTVIAENKPVHLRQVSKLLNRFRGREIRVCLGNGVVETGALEYCFSAEIRFLGGRSIGGRIVRIEVSDDANAE